MRRPVENRTMLMMSATSDRYRGRGMRSSKPTMQLNATTIDVESEVTADPYTGRFNEDL